MENLQRLSAEQLKMLVYWYNPPRKSYLKTKKERIDFLNTIPEITNNVQEIINNIREISESLRTTPHRPNQNTPLPILHTPQPNLPTPPLDISNVFNPETPPKQTLVPEVMEEVRNLQKQTPTPASEPKTIEYHYYCIHKRQKSRCKECGGSQICKHNRNKAYCRDCGGSQICIHKKQRNQCKECKGLRICKHTNFMYCCEECAKNLEK